MTPTPGIDPLFPHRRDRDRGPIDSVDRSPEALATMPAWRRILTHPATIWLPGFILFTAGQIVLLAALLILGHDPHDEAGLEWTGFIPAIFGYAFVTGILEHRRPRELTRHPVGFLVTGLALGAALMALSVGIIHLLGGVEWGPTNSHIRWFSMILVLGIVPGIAEELMFRGIVFRFVEQGLGTWVAIALSAALFGAVHLGNPSATAWSALAIALEAGVMFGALYALTRSLWLVIGVHFAWNVTQGLLFGYHVSGVDEFSGWLSPTPVGDPALSGGEFGVEASFVALVVCGIVSLVTLVLLVRRGGVIRPAWVRGRQMTTADEIDELA